MRSERGFIVEFTYAAYENLLNLLMINGYAICGYQNFTNYSKCVILRHDVDCSLDMALNFAMIEHKHMVKSTYFVLLSSNFYNIASLKNLQLIDEIKRLGHEIGLHFDEAGYDSRDVPTLIEKERLIMTDILGIDIKTVSMHRPSKETLEADYQLNNAVNSYSTTFFKDFKYLSDSRRNWREPVLDIITGKAYDRLHILTHPFWYSENDTSASEIIIEFVNNANSERYSWIKENIRDIEEFIRPGDIK